ncbi:MAG: carboxypeptidase-like regulatory domain-containing protein [Psychromonas sp.]
MQIRQTLRSIELGCNIQALIVVQLNDAISNTAIEQATSLQTFVRYPGEVDFSPFSAHLRNIAGGYFVYVGNASDIFPKNLNPADSVDFRFDISATGYDTMQATQVVSATAITPLSTAVITPQQSVDALLVNAPVIQQNFSLQPNSVGLQGSVIDDNDFSNPIAGVSVRVIAPAIEPAAISDAQGRYRLDSLPVASSVTLEIDNLGEVTTIQHLIDFATPLNTRVISLNG